MFVMMGMFYFIKHQFKIFSINLNIVNLKIDLQKLEILKNLEVIQNKFEEIVKENEYSEVIVKENQYSNKYQKLFNDALSNEIMRLRFGIIKIQAQFNDNIGDEFEKKIYPIWQSYRIFPNSILDESGWYGGCHFHLRSAVPENKSNYKNSYILIDKQLYYVNCDEEFLEIFINDFEQFFNYIQLINTPKKDTIYLTDKQIQCLISSNDRRPYHSENYYNIFFDFFNLGLYKEYHSHFTSEKLINAYYGDKKDHTIQKGQVITVYIIDNNGLTHHHKNELYGLYTRYAEILSVKKPRVDDDFSASVTLSFSDYLNSSDKLITRTIRIDNYANFPIIFDD